ncbi:MAG: DUF3135 domain-containing protein [Desulfomonile tiedjei]|nr:DUF3135 domain-containing protein [Desulfomonile tiedjei]
MDHLSSVRSPQHAEALKERDRFLFAHPELANLQKQIDRRLKGATTEHNRLVLIHRLMMDSFIELDEKLQYLMGRGR